VREDEGVVDFEYIRSRGAHGHHRYGSFDAFVGSEREIWIGSDGSGLIRETSGPVSFFTEAGRAQWEAAGSLELEHGPSIDLFAPGCLGGSRMRRARLDRDLDGLEAALKKHATSLHDVQELLGEAVVGADFCQTVYDIACQLPDVEIVPELTDQLGRVGRGVTAVQLGERMELIFAGDRSELLGYQWFVAQPQPFAPVGTLHSWSGFLERAVVDSLPPEVPPIPQLPCEPAGAGRAFPIRPGFIVSTGYVNDAVAQLAKLLEQGVISANDYKSAKRHASGE
jgi:hypothetical protein